jgi:HEAT repeats
MWKPPPHSMNLKSKRRRIQASVYLGGGAILLLWLMVCLRPREPVYHGKQLSYWTEHLSGAEFAQSYDAVRAIGADGVPWLLGRVRSIHGLRERAYSLVWPRLPVLIRKRLPSPLEPKPVEEKVTYALSLLESNGVPRLVAAFQDRQRDVRRIAVLAIGRMFLTDQVVNQSVPGLSKLLGDSDQSVRMAVIGTLGKMGIRAKAAVPALIEAVTQSQSQTKPVPGLAFRPSAVRLLGFLGPEAKAAVPELTGLLKSPDRDVRSQAAIALWRINRDTNMVAVMTLVPSGRTLVGRGSPLSGNRILAVSASGTIWVCVTRVARAAENGPKPTCFCVFLSTILVRDQGGHVLERKRM